MGLHSSTHLRVSDRLHQEVVEEVSTWTSQSVNLNIIKNMWTDFKRAVRARRPTVLQKWMPFSGENGEKTL